MDGTTTCVSVPSTIGVSVWPYIEMDSNGKKTYRYYYFDEDEGSVEYKDLTEEEYSREIEAPKQYQKKN